MEILIALGMVWPVSSDKWKAPLVPDFIQSLPLSDAYTWFCPFGFLIKEVKL